MSDKQSPSNKKDKKSFKKKMKQSLNALLARYKRIYAAETLVEDTTELRSLMEAHTIIELLLSNLQP
jgi:hypothetical protein